MKEFDAYGDTGFMDYWIQDIRANRNLVLQNILKDVIGTVEEGRLNGIKESNDFRNYLKELKSRAAKDGKSVSLDNIIDDDGRLIQPNNPIWEEKMKKKIQYHQLLFLQGYLAVLVAQCLLYPLLVL